MQEEILFLIYPELLMIRYLGGKLDHVSAYHIIGAERFNATSGYGSKSFRWQGPVIDTLPRYVQIVLVPPALLGFVFYTEILWEESNRELSLWMH